VTNVEAQGQPLAPQVGHVGGKPALAGAVEPLEQPPAQAGEIRCRPLISASNLIHERIDLRRPQAPPANADPGRVDEAQCRPVVQDFYAQLPHGQDSSDRWVQASAPDVSSVPRAAAKEG
jgi:hypothetical protein